MCGHTVALRSANVDIGMVCESLEPCQTPSSPLLRLAAAALFGCWVVGVESASLGGRRLVLDTRLCSVQVQTAVLDVLINPLCCFQEGFFHIFSSEGRRKANKEPSGTRTGRVLRGHWRDAITLTLRLLLGWLSRVCVCVCVLTF